MLFRSLKVALLYSAQHVTSSLSMPSHSHASKLFRLSFQLMKLCLFCPSPSILAIPVSLFLYLPVLVSRTRRTISLFFHFSPGICSYSFPFLRIVSLIALVVFIFPFIPSLHSIISCVVCLSACSASSLSV